MGYFRTDLDGNILMANDRLFHLLKMRSLEEARTIGLMNLYVDPARRGELLRILMEQGRVDAFEVALYDTDRVPVEFELFGSILNDEGGRPKYVEGHLLEVSERKRIERELQETLDKTKEQLQVIQWQRDAISQMSTPVMEIWEDVLVLPIVGVVDTKRSLDIMSTLLGRIVEMQSRCAIIDITGVEVVDTKTADYLLKVVRAAGLLGTRCVLTGLSPAVAQTLVEIGAELGEVTTLRNLKEGLKDSLKYLRAQREQQSLGV